MTMYILITLYVLSLALLHLLTRRRVTLLLNRMESNLESLRSEHAAFRRRAAELQGSYEEVTSKKRTKKTASNNSN